MSYEIIGKLAITIGILILIPIIWIIGYIFLDWLSDKFMKVPDKPRAIICFILLGLMIIGLGVLIYYAL
jgi:sugar phosphate permease